MFSLKDAAIQGPVEAQWLFDFRRCWRWCRAKLFADVSEPRVKGEGVFHWFGFRGLKMRVGEPRPSGWLGLFFRYYSESPALRHFYGNISSPIAINWLACFGIYKPVPVFY